jgi:hypothetical protein
MSFPNNVGMDTAGDFSGAAWDDEGSEKVEWAYMLKTAFDPATGSFKTGDTTTVVSGITKVKTTITFNGGATQLISTLPAKSILYDVLVVVTTAFDGTATINIGPVADADGVLANAHITKTLAAVSGEDVTLRGAELFSTNPKSKYYSGITAINATLGSLGTTTTGVADVYLIFA